MRDAIIRSTTEADWQMLRDIRLAALLEAPTAFGVTHAQALAYTPAQWRERAAGRGPARYVLALTDGQAVGMAAYVARSGAAANLIAMWVRPSARGSAVAGRLVHAVKSGATRDGFTQIVLEVAPDNSRAVALYQKHGFVFLQEWEPLASFPEIRLQRMRWSATLPAMDGGR